MQYNVAAALSRAFPDAPCISVIECQLHRTGTEGAEVPPVERVMKDWGRDSDYRIEEADGRSASAPPYDPCAVYGGYEAAAHNSLPCRWRLVSRAA
jgi:hypothetical protein